MSRQLLTGLSLIICLAACGSDATLAITDLDPRAGATQGEQAVKIAGENFRQDIGYTVYFGNKKSNSVTILDSQTLLVSTPQQEQTGPVDVVVVADNGPAFRIHKGFRYEDMGGGVMERVGETTEGHGPEKY